jgi:hypothetical protein
MSGTDSGGASVAMHASTAAGIATSEIQPSGHVPSVAASHDTPSSVAFPMHLSEQVGAIE